MKKVVLFSLMIIGYLSVDAQILFTGDVYAQNFNGYEGNAATLPTGWTTMSTGTQAFQGTGDGTVDAAGDWAYGGLIDYSMGSYTDDNTGDITFCIDFTNNTGSTISELNIAYVFEQWRYGSNTDGFTVTGTGALSTIDLTGLDQSASTTGVDGIPSFTVKLLADLSVNISAGGAFGVCFSHINGASSDNGISIDDFILSLLTINLPISLRSFDATPMSTNSVELAWVTESEENNSHFVIEHSMDGRNFEALDHMAGAGNSFEPQHYHFMHKGAARGQHYYRLKQVDFDGAFSYSPVRAVILKDSKNISLYPSLAQDELHLVLPEGNLQSSRVQIININGQTVAEQDIEAGVDLQRLDVSQLHAGYYLLHLTADGYEESLRFVKQ